MCAQVQTFFKLLIAKAHVSATARETFQHGFVCAGKFGASLQTFSFAISSALYVVPERRATVGRLRFGAT